MTTWRAEIVRCGECKENPVDLEYPICRDCIRARNKLRKRIKAICYKHEVSFEDAKAVVAWNDAFRDNFMERVPTK
jgi:hypothetical protein